jgi:hypothetical protein
MIAVSVVRMPTRATGGKTASTTFPITGSEPKKNCAASNAANGATDCLLSLEMLRDYHFAAAK